MLRCFPASTLPNGSHISLGAMLPYPAALPDQPARWPSSPGWVTGVLAMLLLPAWQPVHWAQPFVEQLICFSALGYAGVFGTDRRWKIVAGTALAVVLSVTSHIMAGAVFFAQYAWDGYGPWAYSILPTSPATGAEGLATIIIVSFLPISPAAPNRESRCLHMTIYQTCSRKTVSPSGRTV